MGLSIRIEQKSESAQIADLKEEIGRLGEAQTRLHSELAEARNLDTVQMEMDLMDAKEALEEEQADNKDLQKDNKTLQEKTEAMAKTISNLADNLLSLKQKHRHEVELMAIEMKLTTKKANTTLTSCKLIKSEVSSFTRQIMDKAMELKITHELTEASLEMQ